MSRRSCSEIVLTLQIRLAGKQEAQVRILPWGNVCLWSRYDPHPHVGKKQKARSFAENLNLLRSLVFLYEYYYYITGLLITYIALNLMDGHGQPALLYIVPFILGKSPQFRKESKKLSYDPKRMGFCVRYFDSVRSQER